MPFSHLHLHTEYSLLDGACRIENLIKKAGELNLNSLAITDHGVMYGAMSFYTCAKKHGIKPIIGCEVYVAARTRFDKAAALDSKSSHLVLLCKDNIGYQNLCKIVSQSFTEGYYYKPRVDKELLSAHSQGLVALSACLQGELARHILNGDITLAEETARWYKNTFGSDYYIEVQDHGIIDQKRVNIKLIEIAEKLDIKIVATNDVHYVEKSDHDMQKTLILIGTNKTVLDEDTLEFETQEFYLKSEEEMLQLFPEEYIKNTEEVAKKCNAEFDFETLHLPKFEIKDCDNHYEYFRKKCFEGLRERGITLTDEYKERLEYEIKMINKMGYVDYYLIVADFVNYAKAQDIAVGPGRGSGAASLCAYCLCITDIDPIEYNLLFERFLNPERVSMPDFDIDFCAIRRGEVIEYVIEKYGNDHVAQIITFGTLAAKAAVKDVGRAMAVPYSTVDAVSKLIPRDLGQTLENALKESEELKNLYENDEKIKKIIDMARCIEGMPRHASTHAAGVVITDKPVYEYVPLATNDNAPVTQYTMNELEQIGLLKMDFLGLRNLTVIDDAVREIRKTEPDFDIKKIPLDCEEVYKMLSKGLSEGVFQFESSGMKSTMMQLKPSNIEDLIALLSLYRPGPAKSIPKYIENKHSSKEIDYPSPLLKPILSVTYGCMVYQEQVMQIVEALADYTLGRADILIRAMKKKNHEVMAAEEKNFIDGCIKKGVSEDTAKSLFSDISAFSSYAFNKAHAAAYSLISYQTAYLKCRYPGQYMTALLTSVLHYPSKVQSYIEECTRLKIKVLPPCINNSGYNYTVDDQNNIRFGLLTVKNVGRILCESILREREQNGPYSSIQDFCKRCRSRELNRRAVESLIKGGSFDTFGYTRRELLENLDNIFENFAGSGNQNISGQLDLFSAEQAPQDASMTRYEEFPRDTLLALEKEVIGFYISGHPLSGYDGLIRNNRLNRLSEIIEEPVDDARVKVLCCFTKVRKKNTKKGESMAFATVEDIGGECELIIFPKIFSKFSSEIIYDKPTVISGRISVKDEETVQIICENIENAENYDEKSLYVRIESAEDEALKKLQNIAARLTGNTPLLIFCKDTKKLIKSDKLRVTLSDELLNSLRVDFGEDNVKIK